MNKLWGGRFKKKIDKDFFEFQKSIHYDYKLAEYDILHSLIHVGVLYEAGILKREEQSKLLRVLSQLLKEVRSKTFKPDTSAEDIHTDIYLRVEKKVGKFAFKLQTLRSRNDQIVFDEKWYCLKQGIAILGQLASLLESLKFLMNKYKDCSLVGYTHTQRAQVVTWKDYLAAFYYMFDRDCQRIDELLEKLVIYVGSGALAGSSLKRENFNKAIRRFLFKNKITSKIILAVNSLDNVSDRDFIIEFLSMLSILQMHLSRIAEDFIIYSSKEFDFLDLPEAFCTGSSLMPHKKNPDFLELVRGNTGRIYGNLISVLTTMKGLPLTYNRDMQLDKEPLFSSIETVKDELKILAKFIKGIKLKKNNIRSALEDESLYATELAEFLVFRGVPFKKAHQLIGRLIRYSEDKKVKIRTMSDKLLKSFHTQLNQKEIRRIMNPRYAVSSKKSVSRRFPKKKR